MLLTALEITSGIHLQPLQRQQLYHQLILVLLCVETLLFPTSDWRPLSLLGLLKGRSFVTTIDSIPYSLANYEWNIFTNPSKTTTVSSTNIGTSLCGNLTMNSGALSSFVKSTSIKMWGMLC